MASFKVTAGNETTGEEITIQAENEDQARALYQVAHGDTALPILSVTEI